MEPATGAMRHAFAPCTAPGDQGLFDVAGERAQLVELTTTSPMRRTPPCPLFGDCGGCALQHLSDDAYTDYKRDRIRSALARYKLEETPITAIHRPPDPARRRAVFALTRKTIGFNRRASHEIVPVTNCLVLHPTLNARLSGLAELGRILRIDNANLAATLCDNGLDIDIRMGRVDLPSPDQMADLGAWMTAQGCVRLAINGELILQISAPVVEMDGLGVTPPIGGFLQASAEGEAALRSAVREAIAAFSEKKLKIADLFCGAGAFALPLAREHRVTAIDADGPACAVLKDAAGAHQAAGRLKAPIAVETRNLFERPLSEKELAGFDVVLFDPPRAGAREQAVQLARSTVPLIIGVSCNPETFARDAAILTEGRYALTRISPVDQFAYAAHIELVGVFTRKAD